MSVFVDCVRGFSQVVGAALAWFGLALVVSSIGSKIERVRRDQWKLGVFVVGCSAISVMAAKNIDDGIYNLLLFPFIIIKTAVFMEN